jgi:hypothetical protein
MSKIWQIGQLPPQHPEVDRKPQSVPVVKRKPPKRRKKRSWAAAIIVPLMLPGCLLWATWLIYLGR